MRRAVQSGPRILQERYAIGTTLNLDLAAELSFKSRIYNEICEGSSMCRPCKRTNWRASRWAK